MSHYYKISSHIPQHNLDIIYENARKHEYQFYNLVILPQLCQNEAL